MVRNYSYPTAVFFSFVYRFLQDFIKVDNDDDYDNDNDNENDNNN